MSLSNPPSASSSPSLTDASSTSAPTTTEAQSTSTTADTTPSLTTTPSATTQPTSTSSSTAPPVTTDTTSTSSSLPTSTSSSSAVVTTTSSSSVTSVLPSQTTAPTPITTSSSTPDTQTTVHQTSLVATTIVITQSNGQQLTSTSTVLATSSSNSSAGAASTTTTTSSGSSPHTGAIVGGTIGGIAGVALLTALIWFLYKRNRSNRLSANFDGNFDPDRIVARPPDVGLNLDDERDNDGMGGRLGGADIGAGVVSPFPISASTNSHGSSGQSYANYYSGSPASPPPMSQYSGESSGYPAAIFNPYAMSIPPRSPPPGSSSSGLGGGAGGMSAKEREARQNQLGVVNPDERSAYLANGPTGVVQHQDAGPSEIPPAYDSWGGAGASGSK